MSPRERPIKIDELNPRSFEESRTELASVGAALRSIEDGLPKSGSRQDVYNLTRRGVAAAICDPLFLSYLRCSPMREIDLNMATKGLVNDAKVGKMSKRHKHHAPDKQAVARMAQFWEDVAAMPQQTIEELTQSNSDRVAVAIGIEKGIGVKTSRYFGRLPDEISTFTRLANAGHQQETILDVEQWVDQFDLSRFKFKNGAINRAEMSSRLRTLELHEIDCLKAVHDLTVQLGPQYHIDSRRIIAIAKLNDRAFIDALSAFLQRGFKITFPEVKLSDKRTANLGRGVSTNDLEAFARVFSDGLPYPVRLQCVRGFSVIPTQDREAELGTLRKVAARYCDDNWLIPENRAKHEADSSLLAYMQTVYQEVIDLSVEKGAAVPTKRQAARIGEIPPTNLERVKARISTGESLEIVLLDPVTHTLMTEEEYDRFFAQAPLTQARFSSGKDIQEKAKKLGWPKLKKRALERHKKAMLGNPEICFTLCRLSELGFDMGMLPQSNKTAVRLRNNTKYLRSAMDMQTMLGEREAPMSITDLIALEGKDPVVVERFLRLKEVGIATLDPFVLRQAVKIASEEEGTEDKLWATIEEIRRIAPQVKINTVSGVRKFERTPDALTALERLAQIDVSLDSTLIEEVCNLVLNVEEALIGLGRLATVAPGIRPDRLAAVTILGKSDNADYLPGLKAVGYPIDEDHLQIIIDCADAPEKVLKGIKYIKGLIPNHEFRTLSFYKSEFDRPSIEAVLKASGMALTELNDDNLVTVITAAHKSETIAKQRKTILTIAPDFRFELKMGVHNQVELPFDQYLKSQNLNIGIIDHLYGEDVATRLAAVEILSYASFDDKAEDVVKMIEAQGGQLRGLISDSDSAEREQIDLIDQAFSRCNPRLKQQLQLSLLLSVNPELREAMATITSSPEAIMEALTFIDRRNGSVESIKTVTKVYRGTDHNADIAQVLFDSSIAANSGVSNSLTVASIESGQHHNTTIVEIDGTPITEIDPDSLQPLLKDNLVARNFVNGTRKLNIKSLSNKGLQMVVTSRLRTCINRSQDPTHWHMADMRNRAQAVSKNLDLSDGRYLVHATQTVNLPPIMELGNLCGEVLGLKAKTDSYPFYVDGYTTKSGTFNSTYNGGEINLVFGNSEDLSIEAGMPGISKGGMGDNHLLVLIGIPITSLRAIKIKDVKKDFELVKALVIERGFYIPIYDAAGNLLFSAQDYDQALADRNVKPNNHPTYWQHMLTTGSQMGLNPADQIMLPSPNGPEKYYAKWTEITDETLYTKLENERFSEELYRLAGARVLSSELVRVGTRVAKSSRWINGFTPIKDAKQKAEFNAFAVMDMWTANWDLIGTAGNVMQLFDDPEAIYRIDHGGSLGFRAKNHSGYKGHGSPNFGPAVHELKPGSAAQQFGKDGMRHRYDVSDEALAAQAQKLLTDFPDKVIRDLANEFRMHREYRELVTKRLIERRDYIAEQLLK